MSAVSKISLIATGTPCSGTDRLTAQTKLVRRARLRERMIGVEKRPRFNLRIDVTDTRQASFDELLRANYAVADQPRRFGRGE